MFPTVEEVLLANIKDAWPYLSLDDQKRWCIETNYSKNPRGASKELIDNLNVCFGLAYWDRRYGADHDALRAHYDTITQRGHNRGPPIFEGSTFERCAQQGELFVDCALGPPPGQNASGKRVTAMLGPNGPAWQEEECCVYVVNDGWAGGRELVIQNNHCDYAHIRLRDDVSNEEALRLGHALLQAIAAPPEPYDED
jgi:hypothetical protein